MATPQPGIGDWYRLNGGALFEVVALDDDDGTIEIQYFDGTVEEMDIEDWDTQWEDGALESAEAPEDWSGSVDVETSDDVRGAARIPSAMTAICAPAPSTASTSSIRPRAPGLLQRADVDALGEHYESAAHVERERRKAAARHTDRLRTSLLTSRTARRAMSTG